MPGPQPSRKRPFAFMLSRGGIYAARSLPANDRLPYTRGPHICGPYNSAAMERRSCGARLGRDKSLPYEYFS